MTCAHIFKWAVRGFGVFSLLVDGYALVLVLVMLLDVQNLAESSLRTWLPGGCVFCWKLLEAVLWVWFLEDLERGGKERMYWVLVVIGCVIRCVIRYRGWKVINIRWIIDIDEIRLSRRILWNIVLYRFCIQISGGPRFIVPPMVLNVRDLNTSFLSNSLLNSMHTW